MKRDLQIVLAEMREFISRCKMLTACVSAEDFKTDIRTQEAIYGLVIKFGEAAAILQRDHQDLLQRFPGLPARSAADMRNRLIHGYWSVNLDILYDVATCDLPAAEHQIVEMQQSIT